MFLVGLSGGIASGKSTVVLILRKLGCAVIDADVLARQVVQQGTPAYNKIVYHFGKEVLLDNGELDREKLGSIIFSDPEKRGLLNSITHSPIRKAMLKQILWYFFLGYRYVILDIPLLFESRNLIHYMKHTILVYCDPQTQTERLILRNGLSREDAMKRLASQLPIDSKVPLADLVINNSGDRDSTRQQVLQLHARLEASLSYLPVRVAALTMTTGIVACMWILLRRFWL
ncbi:dephospho- kinase domain-containing isoform X2 [Pelobates cultripes]|uniref:Dephospho-CoA kinase domain-containing protein n=1 Tax=Pelobates cultripes TaxID=61616 RepID=A0AAD1WFT4_PELCU|nr:dephospho- kinase domain-containing isoform X2 [Pelobates cultripes]